MLSPKLNKGFLKAPLIAFALSLTTFIPTVSFADTESITIFNKKYVISGNSKMNTFLI